MDYQKCAKLKKSSAQDRMQNLVVRNLTTASVPNSIRSRAKKENVHDDLSKDRRISNKSFVQQDEKKLGFTIAEDDPKDD